MEVWGIWTQSQASLLCSKWAKGGGKLNGYEGMPGAGLTSPPLRQAPSDRLALKPYWGKPTVRDFRGDDGNVGIIRSPVRAIVLLDHFGVLGEPSRWDVNPVCHHRVTAKDEICTRHGSREGGK